MILCGINGLRAGHKIFVFKTITLNYVCKKINIYIYKRKTS